MPDTLTTRLAPGLALCLGLAACGEPAPSAEMEAIAERGELIVLTRNAPTTYSSYVERLEELRAQVPGLTWEARADLTTEQILEKVWRREVDCAVADSNIVAVNRRYFPELKVMMPLTEEESLAWMLPPDSRGLQRELNRWFAGLEDNGLLAILQGRYYGHVEIFDYVDLARFRRRIDSLLPRFRPLFEEAAAAYDLDWTLLAAQAYQESHWDPAARSPTGVRGMMMLTQLTAGELNVNDRPDPAQSIRGGARYQDILIERLSVVSGQL